MDDSDDPDQQARSTTQYQMHQKDAFEPLSFQLPLPGENASNHHRYRCHRRGQQIAISCCGQNSLFRPLRQKIKRHTCDKECDRKMNQDHVLRMFGQQRRFEVEWMQGLSPFTAR